MLRPLEQKEVWSGKGQSRPPSETASLSSFIHTAVFSTLIFPFADVNGGSHAVSVDLSCQFALPAFDSNFPHMCFHSLLQHWEVEMNETEQHRLLHFPSWAAKLFSNELTKGFRPQSKSETKRTKREKWPPRGKETPIPNTRSCVLNLGRQILTQQELLSVDGLTACHRQRACREVTMSAMFLRGKLRPSAIREVVPARSPVLLLPQIFSFQSNPAIFSCPTDIMQSELHREESYYNPA